ncbi:MAG: tyrosine--tRNA ligase [Candidatus Bathyarchaeota archaeon]|nr:MAG: tyrosine--tRNA ligase [Candidatus Bathyarchaeota archaeon]
MDIEERIHLVVRNTDEIVTPDELRILLETTPKPKAYWGFELSGLMHIGFGLVCGSKIRDMIDAGFDFVIFLADWHSWINNKLDGNMTNIRTCGEYFKQGFTALGIKPRSVKYIWASDIAKNLEYWEKVIRIAKGISLQRTWRALPIMGREMGFKDVETAWMYYPCMQAADIFHLDLDVACAGLDQRKAHMVAREASGKLNRKKPICVHSHLIMGLQEPEKTEGEFDENTNINLQISSKMSKSKPGSCIFIHDTENEINRKIRAAYCPPKQVLGNPVLELARYTIFPNRDTLQVTRPTKYGGSETFETYGAIEEAYVTGKLHPLDLKNGVAESLVAILKPAREYFQCHPQTLQKMMEMGITR